MSILNVFITPESGLVGVDTEAVGLRDSVIFESCKLVAAPLTNSVIAFRGTDYLLKALMANIVCFGGTLEEMLEGIPELLKASADYCRKHFQAEEEALGLEMVIVGYSQAEGCVVGHLYRRAVGSEDIQVDRIPYRYRSPFWSAEDFPSGLTDDRAGMEMLARHQSRLARERKPDFAAGGRFLIAEVRQHIVSIEKAFDFPSR
ncbi:hypothetical protein [Pseudomonas sp. BMS12]|uniref:hypothetical protein n=1 Tax=Pseudomonas sp. BMS12 TaxID=1796033 RepID=UPI00083A59EA|nr:hypothetical protein [Pseudomonas sp. BMS12]